MRPHPLVLVALLLPAVGAGQESILGRQSLAFETPEAWAMKYFGSIVLLTGQGTPESIPLGALRLSLEAGNIPQLSRGERTVGFGGTKEEDLNKLGVLVRPRVTIGLPGHFSLVASFVPPIQLEGVTPNLYALSLGRPLIDDGAFRVGLRVFGQLGGIEGDFTCPEDGRDFVNAFDCEEPSSDRFGINQVSVELGGSYRIAGLQGLEPYLLLEANYLDLTFDVNARYGGLVDRTSLHTKGFTGAMVAGLNLPLGRFFAINAQVFFSPLVVRRPADLSPGVDGLINARFFLEWKPL